MRVSRSLFLFGALLFCGVLHSNVNVNNGNFHVAFLDLQVRNGGLGIEIIRTYNSRSNFIRGLFGVGWSSELDTYLRTENEKTITYYHGGGGNVLRFVRDPKSDLYENKLFGYQKLKQLKNGFILETSSSRRYRFNQNGQLTKIEDSNKNFIELERREGLLVRLRDNFNNQVNVKTEKHGAYPRVVLLSRGGEKARRRRGVAKV